VAVLAGLGLVAAACGGDDSSASSGTTAAGAESTTSSPAQSGGSTTTAASGGATPQSIQDWEALWSKQRAAVVKKITDNKWGTSADGKSVTGAGGFAIDLTKCPAGWSQTEGLSDTTIKAGYVLAQSGTAAAGAGLAKAEDAIFKHQAELGGFKDSTGKIRNVQLITRDDAYDPARTGPLVDELIDSEKVFLVQTSGTPPTLQTYDKLNQRCIPQPITGSGHSAIGDPVNHPWTTNPGFSYSTESIIWGSFIEQHLAEFGGKAKVGLLRINNDAGAIWESALKGYLDQSSHKADIEVKYETHESTAATITDQMTTLAAFKPDVFIMASTGTPCAQALAEAAQDGMKESVTYKFFGSACKATGAVTKDKAGDTSDGWWSAGGGNKDLASPAFDQDPWVQAARSWLTAAGYDPKEPIMNVGMSYAWTLQQGLLIAGDLPGGLTRSNLIVALRHMDMTDPELLTGIKFNMSGNDDAFLVEGSDLSQWTSAQQAWIQKSLIDLSGKTKNCAWDKATSACK
jgi:ABC-type branched-subunit amino acid transport system substrate-binding protein